MVFIVIFYMVEERAYYSEDFSRPVYVSTYTSHDILSNETSQVQTEQISIKNESSNKLPENYEPNDIPRCREATVRGKNDFNLYLIIEYSIMRLKY